MTKTTRHFLRWLIVIYILLTFTIAGLNYGYSPKASPQVASLIHFAWEMFENPFKSVLILIGAFFTWKSLDTKKPPYKKNRAPLLLGFIASAAIVHLLGPLLLNNWELYFVSMPLPWSTTGLQLAAEGSAFHGTMVSRYGELGTAIMTTLFWGYNAGILLVTALGGRRIWCSQLCLFNGFIAENYGAVLPLSGRPKAPSPKKVRMFTLVRWTVYALGLVFSSFWLLTIINPELFTPNVKVLLANLELVKYFSFDLMAIMVFWIFWGPRTYCMYCPAGTSLGIVSKHIARAAITTGHSHCTSCTLCVSSCPVGLKPMEFALQNKSLYSTRCLGCGHCVEACPTQNLRLSTAVSRFIENHPILVRPPSA